jgi:hypothetical protein
MERGNSELPFLNDDDYQESSSEQLYCRGRANTDASGSTEIRKTIFSAEDVI